MADDANADADDKTTARPHRTRVWANGPRPAALAAPLAAALVVALLAAVEAAGGREMPPARVIAGALAAGLAAALAAWTLLCAAGAAAEA